MGGHGGLNILPQKSWNVYNYDNREKVRRDEEAAAKEEQLKREQSRRRDSELRLDLLRQARGLPSSTATAETLPPSSDSRHTATAETLPPSSDSRHINLFDGTQDFSSLGSAANGDGGNARKFKREEAEDGGSRSGKKQRREERSAATMAALEDEKYKLGYGLAGKGVKAPWYLSRGSSLQLGEADGGIDRRRSHEIGDGSRKKKGSGKKTIEELREERLRREKQEKEREQALFASMAKKEKGFSRRRF